MKPRLLAAATTALLSACAGGPLPPDWQLQAKPALESAVAAYLLGDSRTAQREFERARGLLARTGQPGWVARGELMRCAAQVASLDFTPCEGFERLRADAPAAEQAYADHLAGRTLPRAAIELLPPAQRAAASAIADKSTASLQPVEDPLSRLIAAALLFRAGQADPGTIALAADTASAQGWRRPLLAWLEVQALRAERAGAADEAQHLRRRIALVTEQRTEQR
jgi:hypothetical protein